MPKKQKSARPLRQSKRLANQRKKQGAKRASQPKTTLGPGATRGKARTGLRTTRARAAPPTAILPPLPAPTNVFSTFSHGAMDVEFQKVGLTLGTNAATGTLMTLVPDGKGYKDGEVLKMLKKPIAKDKFGGKYRGIQKKQDELLSTSSVRELMVGVHGNKAITPAQLDEVERQFENISRVRFPTGYTGFSLQNDIMQHPTGKGTGFFTESSLTMARHNELDLERKQEVLEAMTEAMKAPGATNEDIVRAGLRASIGYTLNVFAAPITASDVQPYARGISGKTQAELNAQVDEREGLKRVFVGLGGRQDTLDLNTPAGQSRTRAWGGRKAYRSASPPRI